MCTNIFGHKNIHIFSEWEAKTSSSNQCVLTRIFRYLNNKIDLAVFQEGEEGELKSETGWTKVSDLLREALGLL